MVQAGVGGGGRAGEGTPLVSALASQDTLDTLAQLVAQELLDDAILSEEQRERERERVLERIV